MSSRHDHMKNALKLGCEIVIERFATLQAISVAFHESNGGCFLYAKRHASMPAK